MERRRVEVLEPIYNDYGKKVNSEVASEGWFHEWGIALTTDYEESHAYTVALVEDDRGYMQTYGVDQIRFVNHRTALADILDPVVPHKTTSTEEK